MDNNNMIGGNRPDPKGPYHRANSPHPQPVFLEDDMDGTGLLTPSDMIGDTDATVLLTPSDMIGDTDATVLLTPSDMIGDTDATVLLTHTPNGPAPGAYGKFPPRSYNSPPNVPKGNNPPNVPKGNTPPQGYAPRGNVPPQGYRPNNGPYGNVPPQGYRPNNGPYGNVPPQGYRPNNGPYGNMPPQQPKKKKKASPLLFVLIGILSMTLVVATVLGIFLAVRFFRNRPSKPQFPSYSTEDPTQILSPTETLPITTEPITITESTVPTEPPTTAEPTYVTEDPYAYLDDLNQKYGYYFDFQPDEDGHVIAHSSSRLISKSELYGMTEHEVCIARNEIFARHGYIFQTEMYNEYFSNFSWYVPRTRSNPNFSEIEDQNIKLIASYENERGW